jgi:hypothetical protein
MLISLGKAKGRAQEGYPKSAARGIIEAGAPAFGCTVHPLRLQAPRAAYAHKSPGQGDCTATPGWPGGRDGRKSIKSKIIDTTAPDSLIVGNMPYLRWTASPAKNISNGRAGTSHRIPRPAWCTYARCAGRPGAGAWWGLGVGPGLECPAKIVRLFTGVRSAEDYANPTEGATRGPGARARP